MTGRRTHRSAASRPLAIAGQELLRVRFLFGLLGLVPLFLTGWFAVLQVGGGGQLSRGSALVLGQGAVDAQRYASEVLPAPRGSIVDRHGATLAIDAEAYEIRADVTPPRSVRSSRAKLQDYLQDLATELAGELARDDTIVDKVEFRRRERTRLLDRLQGALGVARLPAAGQLAAAAMPGRVNVLVASDVVSPAVAAGLRAVDQRRDSLRLHWMRTYQRVYPDRDATWGLVGYDQALPLHDEAGRLAYRRFGIFGIERIAALQPGPDGLRRFALDAAGNSYWVEPPRPPGPPTVLQATIDLELQKAAIRLLDQQARRGAGEGVRRLPKWGALVLIEVATGDVLAAASWHRDVAHEQGMAFTPYQSLYEPGSIVKPLVFAHALQHGGLDWHRTIDCSSSGSRHERLVEETGRLVRDDHACGVLSPHGILVNSSNIGAVKVGSLLRRDQWRDYVDFYGFGSTLGLELPHESLGGANRRSFDPKVPEHQFRRWTGSSFSIGYEMQVSALQMARAYLTMLSGAQRQLRLYRGVEVDGVRLAAPPAPAGQRRYSPAVVELVREALTDVVSPEPTSTGRHVHALLLKEEGLEAHGLIAGKTGTAASSVGTARGRVEMRNASFVGFAPADRPRYLAVCVLQKDDDARFYGGSYAAPPVARLLLQSLRLEERRRLRPEPQVSVTPGDQAGAGRAPETTQTGG